MTLDAVMVNEVMYVPGTWGCHFLRFQKRKGCRVPKPSEFWVGRRLAGGRGENPKCWGEVRQIKKKTGRIADRPVKPCVFAQRAKSMANK